MFPLLWVTAELFHLIASVEVAFLWRQGQWFYPLEQLLIFILCIAYLIRGRGTALFVAILTLQIVGVLWVLPVIPNHRLLAAFLNIGLLLSIARGRLDQIDEEGLSICRSGVLILYFFAAFHKVNSDYLNPALSCATLFFKPIAESYPGLGVLGRLDHVFPGMSIVIEFALPLLFVCGTTFRRLGLLIAVIFHFILALNADRHFFDFSATMFALVFLFQPLQDRSLNSRPFSLPWRALLALGFVATYISGLGYPAEGPIASYLLIRMRVWALFTVLYVLLLIATVRQGRNTRTAPIQIFPRLGIGRALVILLFLNGILPYLGLKTRSSFDMYSNLQIEEGRTNHLIVPSALLASIYTSDLVTPIASQGPPVRLELFDPQRRMVRFELASLLARTPGLEVTLDDAGTKRTISSPSELYPESAPPPWILRKLLWFRPVEQPGQPGRCQW